MTNFRAASDQSIERVWPTVAESVDRVRANGRPWLSWLTPAGRRIAGLSVGEATLVECANPSELLIEVAPWVPRASLAHRRRTSAAGLSRGLASGWPF